MVPGAILALAAPGHPIITLHETIDTDAPSATRGTAGSAAKPSSGAGPTSRTGCGAASSVAAVRAGAGSNLWGRPAAEAAGRRFLGQGD